MNLPLDTETVVYDAGTLHYADGRVARILHVLTSPSLPDGALVDRLTAGTLVLSVQPSGDAPPQVVPTIATKRAKPAPVIDAAPVTADPPAEVQSMTIGDAATTEDH
jgi:hypothetical protein